MKYIYVLASSEDDLYYEQFFLSIVSLRLCNPAAEIVLLLDTFTKKNLTGNRTGYEKVVSDVVVIEPPRGLSQKESSRHIKTSMRQYITGDFLYIDCDTIIADDLSHVFLQNISIGAVPDCHTPFKKHHYYRQFRDENLRLGFSSILECDNYYNGGIIYCGDTPESYRFFERWHDIWNDCRKKGNSQDMPSFNRANYELHNIISEIDGKWNCQISNNGLTFLSQSKIIHYFATSLFFTESPFFFASKSVLSSIKETDVISSDIFKKLQDPRSAFELNSVIISDKDVLNVLNSSVFSVLRRVSKRSRRLFNAIDAFFYRISFILKQLRASRR
jgi:lipopolysaccharide biosynthesis glycosyltransferase